MLAVIGGSGLNQLDNFCVLREQHTETPFGLSSLLLLGHFTDQEQQILFMPRHGDGHRLPPHKINYRANLWALKESGAKRVLAVNAVGGIRDDMAPGCLVIPNQIIDYTYGREHTYFTGDAAGVEHIDFTHPYDDALRTLVVESAQKAGISVIADGTYGCSQGPRLETAAEIRKLQRDGCDVIGMTGMPEAALARELNLAYCAINLVVNWGAGITEETITMDKIEQVLAGGMTSVVTLIRATVTAK